MRKIKRLFAVLTAIITLFSFSACKDKGEEFIFSGFNTQIIVSVHDKALTLNLKSQIKETVLQLEKEFDGQKTDSVTGIFNAASTGQSILLSNHALTVLDYAKKAYALSNGKFDPTVFPLVDLWEFAPYHFNATFKPPTNDQIIAAKSTVGFDGVTLDLSAKTLSKSVDGVKIDLGGIVKGYAADLIAKLLKDNGYNDGYVNVGGSSLNLLKVNKLNIRHPEKTSDAILEVNCTNKTDISVSTSGTYEKFHLTMDGEKYCHIIDPQTGYPADTGVLSATILGINGVLSDALTTALCLYAHTPQTADDSPLVRFINRLLLEYNEASIFVIYSAENDKIVLTNKEQGKDFTLLDQEYSIYKI